MTEKFLEITHEAYRREIGSQFGKRMPGIFTDEPHLAPAGGLHWSTNMPQEFQKRWGYSLVDHLPSLVRPVGDWKRIRHDYQQYLLEQFIEHWSRPNHDFCEKNGLEWTGHYWEHGWPDASHGPDNMAMYAWHQRPAIDILRNQYHDDVHAQFGNNRSVKELSSVANQLGKKRTLCEVYGAGGWDLRFEDMKRIGDWIYVLGVNTLDQHLSSITLRGARKADYPQSFSYHEPWWEAYHVMAEYFTRLSLAMSSGEQINKVLLIEPTTTAWMYQNDPSHAKHLKKLGDEFQDLLNLLERKQIEYDIGCEDIMGRHGSVVLCSSGPLLTVGRRGYQVVVLPPLLENLNSKTIQLLENYVKNGGMVLCCGGPPVLVDGRPSDRGRALVKGQNWRRVKSTDVPLEEVINGPVNGFLRNVGGLQGTLAEGFAIRRAANDKGLLFHHRRRLQDGELVLLVNSSIDSPSAGEILAKATKAFGVEQWCPQTGTVSPYPYTLSEEVILPSVHQGMIIESVNTLILKTSFTLPPCGSLLLFFPEQMERVENNNARASRRVIPATGPTNIRRIAPNVLTLDYVDLTAGGEEHKGTYFYRANQLAFQKNGMERNPWDSAVQLRDNLISKKFPPESGFEAAYRFTIKDRVPKSLAIVIERPDLYTIACNGRAISWGSGASRPWWLDKAFGRIDIASTAKVGENIVTIKAQPFTIYHEIEPAYLLGDFTLKATAKGFEVVADAPLKLGPWNQQDHPMYAAGVAYAQTFDLPQPSGRYFVRLPKWYGSVAKVVVNGRFAGYIAYQPWQCEVSRFLTRGSNTIEVIVIGTLKNTLGPFHAGTVLGAAGPSMFQQGPVTGPPPGERYHTVGYGLMESFVLEKTDK